ncbi:MAG TPA: MXAN_2562 family outer membrane beta-barrel protein [Polyangia bacterium]
MLALKIGDARADDAGVTPAVATTDVTFTLARLDSEGKQTVLDSNGLATMLNATRCACPTNVVAAISLTDAAAATLGSDTAEITLAAGADCDSDGNTCQAIGPTLTLTAQKTTTTQTLATADLFSAIVGQATCSALPSTSSRLWAIVRVNGERTGAAPSLALDVGAAPPATPTAITVTGGDSDLLIGWKTTGDVSTLAGFQVLCFPGLASPPAAAFAACSEVTANAAAATPDAGAVDGDGGKGAAALASLDSSLVCSSLVAAANGSVRVKGLANGQPYQVAVVAVGSDGTPSALSLIAGGTPAPTLGFADLYRDSDGQALGGCAVSPEATRAAWSRWFGGAVVVLAACLVRRRRAQPRKPRTRRFGWRWRRRRGPQVSRRWSVSRLSLFVIVGAALAAARPAHAGVFDLDDEGVAEHPPAARIPPSPRRWNVELRFGPYRPAVDSEFAERNNNDQPYATEFGPRRRLMSQLELDRQLSHAGGTWALGISAGYFRATAAALEPDLRTRSGDQTALRLIPLSVSLVYRADWLLEKQNVPLVPYAKAGLDCGLWSTSDTSPAAALSGRTLGWHTAAGVALALDFIDPADARAMDQETGVNHTSLFFEFTRVSLDGLGGSQQMHLGDTTWLAGLMLEL